MPKISLKLNSASIEKAIGALKNYEKKVEEAGDKIARELAHLGYSVAYGVMSGHVFSGETIESLEVVEDGPGRYILYAASQAILFFEFGAGAKYGAGHPWDEKLSFGPGTYPSKHPELEHWKDPNGWWFPTDDPRLIIRRNKKTGQGWGHSYGNKPYMPFYKADKAMREDILNAAKEALK